MAIKPEIWTKAKVMFEAGKTLQFIQDETGINQSTVSKKAKKEGWVKGKNQEIIIEESRLKVEKSRLNQDELEFHDKEVERAIKNLKIDNFLDDGIGLAAKKGVEILKETRLMSDVKDFADFANKAAVKLKTQDKFSQPATINNTAQAAVVENSEQKNIYKEIMQDAG